MKRALDIGLIFGSCLLMLSCEPAHKQSGNEIAEEKNEEKFDTRREEKEADFVVKTIEKSYGEIKLAELASSKSSNRDVQEVAQQLVSDYTATITKLQELANAKGIVVPVDEGEDAKKNVNDLAMERQPDFDKKWCDALVDKNNKMIRDFESMREKSDDPQLKEVIDQTLPDLRAHLDKLKSIEKNMM